MEAGLRIFIYTALALCAAVARAQAPWTSEPAVQKRLAAGEVVVTTPNVVDTSHPRGQVRAAVLIKADPDAVWRVMTDCSQALKFVPGMRKCRVVQRSPDGAWADIEQEVRYSWLLPVVHYVFRAQYDRPHRIEFQRLSGDLKEQHGSWVLTAEPALGATLVEYEVYCEPGFWVPQFLVTRSLRKDLPAVLTGLREQVQHGGALVSQAPLSGADPQ